MSLDVLAAIGLTVGAAIVVGGLSASYPGSPTARTAVAAGLTAWFGLIVLLAALGAFDFVRGIGAPGVGAAVLLPVIALSYAGTRPALLQRARLALPLEVLIGVNAVRILGVLFVVLHSAHRLPAPFAPVAGWGDILIGVTAIPVALAALRKPRGWRSVVLLWNLLGLLDLIAAVGLGITSSPGTPFRLFFAEPGTAIMSSLPWVLIPGFLVPLLMVTHLAVFSRRLTRSGRAS